ncbi:hypothetical protein [Rubritalea tangerina]
MQGDKFVSQEEYNLITKPQEDIFTYEIRSFNMRVTKSYKGDVPIGVTIPMFYRLWSKPSAERHKERREVGVYKKAEDKLSVGKKAVVWFSKSSVTSIDSPFAMNFYKFLILDSNSIEPSFLNTLNKSTEKKPSDDD